MLEMLDYLVILGSFVGTTGLLLIAYYLDQKAWKVTMESWRIEMETELRTIFQDFKNTGTGLKSSLTRILGTKDMPDSSLTEIALKELMSSKFMEELLTKGASKLGISGPSVPETANKGIEEEATKFLEKTLSKKEFKFLEEIQQKLLQSTK